MDAGKLIPTERFPSVKRTNSAELAETAISTVCYTRMTMDMTQASKASEVRLKIINTLQGYAVSHPREPRPRCKELEKLVGLEKTPNTFAKYIQELEEEHILVRDPDPKNGSARRVRLNVEEAKQVANFQDALNKINRIQESTKISPTVHDWRKHANGILKGKVTLTQKEEDELFGGSAYKWMLATNELLSIAISLYTKTNDLAPDTYFGITGSTLQVLPREQVKLK